MQRRIKFRQVCRVSYAYFHKSNRGLIVGSCPDGQELGRSIMFTCFNTRSAISRTILILVLCLQLLGGEAQATRMWSRVISIKRPARAQFTIVNSRARLACFNRGASVLLGRVNTRDITRVTLYQPYARGFLRQMSRSSRLVPARTARDIQGDRPAVHGRLCTCPAISIPRSG